MLFNSLEYLAFYFMFFTAFFALKDIRHQVWLIVFGSLVFYGFWSPLHVALLLFVCFVAYSAQLFNNAKYTTSITVTLLLGVLFIFKYYGFFAGQLVDLGLDLAVVDILLPVGISFYVFQAISFVVDRKRLDRATPSELVGYIAFFPQLVAGPIVRASVFLPQLKTRRRFNKYMFYTGMLLFMMGMFKKVVVADNLGLYVDGVYSNAGKLTAANHILAFYLYAVQIYYDFCGYSEMAIGIARTLGFKFPQNFNRPYLSASITEFWRRWHISLSSWLRDYLYIPLGGNRKGQVRTYINLAIVMLLGGLWHGAAWTFVAWGAMHGALLAIERFFDYEPRGRAGRLLGMFITFHLVCIAWVFFRAPDFSQAMLFFAGMFDFSTITVVQTKFAVLKCLALVGLFLIIERYSYPKVFLQLRKPAIYWIVAPLAAALFLLFGVFAETPFIYFQF